MLNTLFIYPGGQIWRGVKLANLSRGAVGVHVLGTQATQLETGIFDNQQLGKHNSVLTTTTAFMAMVMLHVCRTSVS